MWIHPPLGKIQHASEAVQMGSEPFTQEQERSISVDRVENVCGCLQISKGKTQTFIKTLFPSILHCGSVVHIAWYYEGYPSKYGPFSLLGFDPTLHGPTECLSVLKGVPPPHNLIPKWKEDSGDLPHEDAFQLLPFFFHPRQKKCTR